MTLAVRSRSIATCERRSSGPAIARLAGAILLLAAAGGCSVEVAVGALVSESGAASFSGEKVRKGIELAAERARAETGWGGPRVRLIWRDDATSPERGVREAEDLIVSERVVAIVGAVSSTVTLAVAPLCERRRVVLLSPTASTPEISLAGEFVFRVHPSDLLEAGAMADFARDLGLRRVAVLAVSTGYGAALREAFSRRFAEHPRRVVATIVFPPGDTAGLDRSIRTLSNLSADGVYIVGDDAETADILSRLREGGVRSVALGTSWLSAGLVRRAGQAAEGIVFPTPTFDPDSDDPVTARFVEAYRARYGETPDAWSAEGYDAFGVIFEALRRAGSADPDALRRSLAAIDDYRGASGRVAFDEVGDVVRDPRLVVVHSGAMVPYERFVRDGGVLAPTGR